MESMGKTRVLLGAQWGDEGKGRVTDMLASTADVIVRFSGGMNAGHTIIVGAERYELHQIPSGILHPTKKNIIAHGTVVHPESLVREMQGLEQRGLGMEHLYLSEGAHVIMPYHLLLDRLEEERKGDQQIGTTRKGIGPVYTDKVARRGIRVGDLLDTDVFCSRLEQNLAYTNLILTRVYGVSPLTVEAIVEEYRPFVERLRSHVTDTISLLEDSRVAGQEILFEGAQGTLLDIDHGTYPYVTSSNPTVGGVCTGCGIGPTRINAVIGVLKAYLTRVGSGPFPTEDHAAVGEFLRQRGREFGVTTGRARRCGWFDVPLARYAAKINGLTHLVLTKLDVLSGLDTIRVCTGYTWQGQVLREYPNRLTVFSQITPVYEEMSGWQEDISEVREYAALPHQAQAYVTRLEALCGVPIAMISLGPGRDQAILLQQSSVTPTPRTGC